MRWVKRDLWKVGIHVGDVLLLLVLMVWVPVSANAYGGTSGLATPATGTAMPKIDATVTAQSNWFANNSTALIAAVTSLIVALFGIYQWAANRRDVRQKERDAQDKELEDRKAQQERQKAELFQAVVEGLGSEREEAKAGAAITLRTFLQPDYEQFYRQAFDLAVVHLCLSRTPTPREDPNAAQPLTPLSKALIVVFVESFPRALNQGQRDPRSLDATGIQLDNAYLVEADLEEVWMPRSSLRKANLSGANLRHSVLNQANLSGADLIGANLRNARLRESNLRGADLTKADLTEAKLSGADLSGANLSTNPRSTVPLSGTLRSSTLPPGPTMLIAADLSGANLSSANLGHSILSHANLSGANLDRADLGGANIDGANLCGVKGLTKEQLLACKARGALIDEDSMADSSHPPVPSTQVSTPPPSTDGSHSTPSQPSAER